MNILFVCTGNIFRSMSAEYLMKKYLEDNGIEGINVSSAGTGAQFQYPYHETVERLKHHGVDPWGHRQRKLTTDILKDSDVIICMAKHHKKAVELLGYKAFLYKELSEGKEEDLKDDYEHAMEHGWDYDVGNFVYELVDYIHDTIPKVAERITDPNSS